MVLKKSCGKQGLQGLQTVDEMHTRSHIGWQALSGVQAEHLHACCKARLQAGQAVFDHPTG
jgi:thiamine monophosphate synthase